MSDQGTVFGWFLILGIAIPLGLLVWVFVLLWVVEGVHDLQKKIKRGF
jgi:hypothetical protein